MTDRRLSPGLQRLVTRYLELLGRRVDLTRAQLEGLHEIMTRAGTVEDGISCLEWFATDETAPKPRDRMNIAFILACFENWEVFSKKNTLKMGDADMKRIANEYRLMQGIK